MLSRHFSQQKQQAAREEKDFVEFYRSHWQELWFRIREARQGLVFNRVLRNSPRPPDAPFLESKANDLT